MKPSPKEPAKKSQPSNDPHRVSETNKEDLNPAEERGERLDTGKTIARGGKHDGPVPGAEPSSDHGEHKKD
ncbi:hypothetical protein KIH39_17065 [Telmatocola sphagniphila]|jgi:hypothetical protein|uniref:Uncharacterized protein n=1 Tax=Telmatocola sphagniphila TaxID=1123043 RepID=A0A8E6B2K9_9BACT|nr:hypothetical protein [Telmatocola sphagniphila]QVL30556.1 hypothetical protein KIH39_17065 [Telmatocola sphagniphila]